MNSEGDILRERRSGLGLSTSECLEFLIEGKRKYPDAVHVGYGLGYDVNMWCRGRGGQVPYEHMKMLMYKHRVFWNWYKMEYIARKYFVLSSYERVYGDKRNKQPSDSMVIWDALSFFQESFIDALSGVFGDLGLKELGIDIIKAGKASRADFTEDDLQSGRLLDYVTCEVSALCDLMYTFRENCRDCGVQLTRYDGAGAGAAALMRKHKIAELTEKVNMLTPPELDLPVKVAYGGGHSEMYMYGHTDGKVYHYDVRSGFPSKMPTMPDLGDGMWEHNGVDDYIGITRGEFALYKVYWDFRYVLDRFGKRHHPNPFNTMWPFFYRMPWEEPRIMYPPQGYTWVWSPELLVALMNRDYFAGDLRVLEQWVFRPNNPNSYPFAFIRDIYDKRMKYKSVGADGQALALKLFMNAMPGKMAQAVGYNGRYRERPPYFNLMYAGWIQSAVRAQVMEAMMQNPKAIIAVATDGIWSIAPLALDVGEGLGQWEAEVLDRFTSVQAGIYFTNKSAGEPIYHYRGFNQGSISESEIRQKWAERGYSVSVPTRRFIGMGTALRSEEAYKNEWCTWNDGYRTLQIQPNMMQKRQLYMGRDGRPDAAAANELVETYASDVMRFTDNVHIYGPTDKHGVSIETYLSKPHRLPWDEYVEPTDVQRWIDEQERISQEVIESEM